MQYLQTFLKNEEAATAVEYAVMLALILISVVATIQSLGGTVSNLFGNANSEIESHVN